MVLHVIIFVYSNHRKVARLMWRSCVSVSNATSSMFAFPHDYEFTGKHLKSNNTSTQQGLDKMHTYRLKYCLAETNNEFQK